MQLSSILLHISSLRDATIVIFLNVIESDAQALRKSVVVIAGSPSPYPLHPGPAEIKEVSLGWEYLEQLTGDHHAGLRSGYLPIAQTTRGLQGWGVCWECRLNARGPTSLGSTETSPTRHPHKPPACPLSQTQRRSPIFSQPSTSISLIIYPSAVGPPLSWV